MTMPARIERIVEAKKLLYDWAAGNFFDRAPDPDLCNFAVGNPTELPLPGVVQALKHWAEPQNPDWFAYKWSEPGARKTVAESLRAWRGIDFDAEDIAMTTGGFGALATAIYSVIDPGDEVLFNLPPWFNYENMVLALGGEPVKVPVRSDDFDLDVPAIERAITARTRIVIVNSPNNPTGRIYPPETLRHLAEVLTAASARNGRTIYLLSDEAYARLIFNGHEFHSPAAFYPETLMAYSYGKTLLAPGQRLGYLAMPPTVSARVRLREVFRYVQSSIGFMFPNALMQHAIGDLEKLCIDMGAMERKRDVMLAGLRAAGYDVHTPEGTFYLLPRSPIPDDQAFCRALLAENVLVLPGTICEIPGHFRISLTASEEMIARALPRFAKVFATAKS